MHQLYFAQRRDSHRWIENKKRPQCSRPHRRKNSGDKISMVNMSVEENKTKMWRFKRSRAFTIIELILTVAILGALTTSTFIYFSDNYNRFIMTEHTEKLATIFRYSRDYTKARKQEYIIEMNRSSSSISIVINPEFTPEVYAPIDPPAENPTFNIYERVTTTRGICDGVSRHRPRPARLGDRYTNGRNIYELIEYRRYSWLTYSSNIWSNVASCDELVTETECTSLGSSLNSSQIAERIVEFSESFLTDGCVVIGEDHPDLQTWLVYWRAGGPENLALIQSAEMVGGENLPNQIGEISLPNDFEFDYDGVINFDSLGVPKVDDAFEILCSLGSLRKKIIISHITGRVTVE